MDIDNDNDDDDDNDDIDDYSCNSVNFKVRTSRFCMEIDLSLRYRRLMRWFELLLLIVDFEWGGKREFFYLYIFDFYGIFRQF